eukprot:CAMPEP_0206490622 /NCGR_PEP_ID=MMETSP0324_2-20121206/44260_1 /ASSEMBLY_ACC=CAM_ASM_000836 /TAXON_ID=2866 /ORGANISM="Crypthecodinium cohnii, Strain Seligo" /LENGTH=135 /DNA_ID=CAMNT_0053971157 /DNA_START=485 /DNA_END=890 /DNA_ORIENTATION=-
MDETCLPSPPLPSRDPRRRRRQSPGRHHLPGRAASTFPEHEGPEEEFGLSGDIKNQGPTSRDGAPESGEEETWDGSLDIAFSEGSGWYISIPSSVSSMRLYLPIVSPIFTNGGHRMAPPSPKCPSSGKSLLVAST